MVTYAETCSDMNLSDSTFSKESSTFSYNIQQVHGNTLKTSKHKNGPRRAGSILHFIFRPSITALGAGSPGSLRRRYTSIFRYYLLSMSWSTVALNAILLVAQNIVMVIVVS